MSEIQFVTRKVTKDQRELSEKMSSRSRRENARFFRRNGIPPFLYKYLSFDASELSQRKAHDLLVESRFYLSSPASFNDPYDFRANFVAGDLFSCLDRVDANGLLPLGREERERAIRNAVQNSRDREFIQSAFERVANSHGVLCLTSTPRSVLMWSHYAASHKGICLQFETAADFTLFATALPLNYQESIATVRWPEDNDRIVDDVVLRKSSEWRYEREHRYVQPHCAGQYIAFEPSALTGVLLGQRFSEESRDLLDVMLRERAARGFRNPVILKAGRSPTRFRIRIARA